ncbi:MAG: hypothetical protein HQ567_25785 [Candidatus Nealsonbacteria bacterium]|nr:hypothetical protein [Candidatus Nealsonbacteria bacterium]
MRFQIKKNGQLRSLVMILAILPAVGADTSDTLPIDLGDLTMEIPIAWERIEYGNTLLTARGPLENATDTFSENINLKVYPLRVESPLEELFTAQLKEARKEFRILRQGELRVDRHPVKWMTTVPKKAPPSEEVFAMIDYLMVRGRRLYVMHCMVEPDQIEKHQPQFESIVRSIAFKDSASAVRSGPSTENQRRQQEAYEGGRKVGQIVIYVMLAVIAFACVRYLFRRFISQRR